MSVHADCALVQETASVAMRNLISGNMKCTARAGVAGAVEALVEAMRRHTESPGVQSSACAQALACKDTSLACARTAATTASTAPTFPARTLHLPPPTFMLRNARHAAHCRYLFPVCLHIAAIAASKAPAFSALVLFVSALALVRLNRAYMLHSARRRSLRARASPLPQPRRRPRSPPGSRSRRL